MALLRARSRSLWLRLHRWLGLGLGAVFVMLGLTGSLLVFYVGIDEAIEPALAVPGPAPQMQRWHDVLLALQQAHPQRDRGWRIELPPGGRGLVTARYLKPAEAAGAIYKPLLVTVNPATGQVLASRLWGDFAATWVFDLHYRLLAGDAGRTVVGVLGLLMTASLSGGLVLWWPRRGQWRAALRVKLTGSRQRRHYDLHKLAGVGGGAVLLVLAVTGAALALPDWVEPPLARISPPLAMPAPQATLQPGVPLLTLDQALERARAHWPEGVPRWVDTPPAGGAIYRVRLWLPGGPSERFPRSYLWIHAQTGQVLASRDARRQSAGDAVLAWLHPLHNGEAFGLAGRVLACVAGLLPLLLMVTGVQRWADRRRAGRARSAALTMSLDPTPPQPAGLQAPNLPRLP
jgi:uncharacterized iron-regulated membrane protein